MLSLLGGVDSVMLPRAGFLIGVVGGTLFLASALLHVLAGYGVWSMQNWGRVLAIILAVISLVFALPGLLMMAMMMSSGKIAIVAGETCESEHDSGHATDRTGARYRIAARANASLRRETSWRKEGWAQVGYSHRRR